eukprot:gene5488-6173_t
MAWNIFRRLKSLNTLILNQVTARTFHVDKNLRVFANPFGRGQRNFLFGVGSSFIGLGVLTYFQSQIKNFRMIKLANALESDGNNDNKPEKLSKRFNFIADAVEVAAPAVVYIQVTSNKYKGRFLGNVVPVNSGSGFIVSEDGIILTNAHVIADAINVEIKMPNGKTHQGIVIDIDPVTDLAAIQIISKTNEKFSYLELGKSSNLRAGEWVAALGSPLSLSNTITAGIISSLHRAGDELGLNREMKYIQTDAAINVGNSGGPLVNLDGEVVGINCITVAAASGISFAIPSDIAREFLENAKKRAKQMKDSSGKIYPKLKMKERYYIGISMLTLTPGIAEELRQRSSRYSKVDRGVFVANVARTSPADRAGLRAGDVIVKINAKDITNSKEVYDAVNSGGQIVMDILRGSATVQISIKPELAGKL